MKKSISINVDADKLSALEMYLEQKNMKLTEELEKFSEQLYQKNVPQNVRDFINMKQSTKPERKPKRNTDDMTNENHYEP